MSSRLENAMTVGQLIEKLSKLDPTLPVMGEGCDCVNIVVDAIEDVWALYPDTTGPKYVLISVQAH